MHIVLTQGIVMSTQSAVQVIAGEVPGPSLGPGDRAPPGSRMPQDASGRPLGPRYGSPGKEGPRLYLGPGWCLLGPC